MDHIVKEESMQSGVEESMHAEESASTFVNVEKSTQNDAGSSSLFNSDAGSSSSLFNNDAGSSSSLFNSGSLKRSRDEVDDEDESGTPDKYPKTVETNTLKEMRSLILGSENYEKEVAEATKRYYIAFFKKTLRELPLCKEVVNVDTIENNDNGFYKAFSIAKTMINCNINIKKYRALGSVIHTFSSFIGKALHSNYIVPLIAEFVHPDTLNGAFAAYQNEISQGATEEFDKTQCISYLIQSELEKQETMKVPHPLIGCLTNHITASSKYVLKILSDVGKRYIVAGIPDMDKIITS